jgi:Mg2+/Co2+ transporter CorC
MNLPKVKQLLDIVRHSPRNTKCVENQEPKITSVLTMDKEVIYDLLILFAKATPIHKSKTPPSKIINCRDSTHSYCPSEERNMVRGIDRPNTFPGEQTRLSSP